ncbi:hypothetical protein H4219_001041 [Mycoemilia scoparia]|uniref:polynucleotide adenylyltransferase n=1 Tax=Mycoemilia scoparia TaxID=417184 RepID=A0A9W8DSA2_9FUNG|nr:hypothetical protein H4219_001041 [Mycoemilia scoparia]
MDWIQLPVLRPWFNIKQEQVDNDEVEAAANEAHPDLKSIADKSKKSNCKPKSHKETQNKKDRLLISYTNCEFDVDKLKGGNLPFLCPLKGNANKSHHEKSPSIAHIQQQIDQCSQTDSGDLGEKSRKMLKTIAIVAREISGPDYHVTTRLFGSVASGLATKYSDLDISLAIKPRHAYAMEIHLDSFIGELKRKLKKCGCSKILAITHARVPVLKFEHRSLQISGDICLNSVLGVYKTQLTSTYVDIDCRVKPFLIILKKWQKRRNVADASFGLLNTYTLSMMALARLIELGVVPPIQQICCLKKSHESSSKCPLLKSAYKDKREPLKDEKASSTSRICLNCGKELQSITIDKSEVYMYNLAKPQAPAAYAGKLNHYNDKKASWISSTGNNDDNKINYWDSPCKMGVRELLIDFFYHYSTTYKPFKDVISVRLGTTNASRKHTTAMFDSNIFKQRNGEPLANLNQPPFVIEDPIETHINCANILSGVAFGYRSEFFKAYTHLLNNDWDGFMEEWHLGTANYKHMDWTFYSILCELSRSVKRSTSSK